MGEWMLFSELPRGKTLGEVMVTDDGDVALVGGELYDKLAASFLERRWGSMTIPYPLVTFEPCDVANWGSKKVLGLKISRPSGKVDEPEPDSEAASDRVFCVNCKWYAHSMFTDWCSAETLRMNFVTGKVEVQSITLCQERNPDGKCKFYKAATAEPKRTCESCKHYGFVTGVWGCKLDGGVVAEPGAWAQTCKHYAPKAAA